MKNYYDYLYLSPHLDDVALSCGGQIYQQTAMGKSVLIVTSMAGDPPLAQFSTYIQSLHERWELATDAAAARRAEDLAACQILGADAYHLTIPDCIYRYDDQVQRFMYLSDEDIFGDVHQAEAGLVDALTTQLAQLPMRGRVLAPLTIGHHVDHLLVRAAAKRAFGSHISYYEDYPYAQQPGKLEALFAAQTEQWHSETIRLSEAAIQAKLEAILAFRSQFSTFFTDRADLERQVRGYAQLVGGERVWMRA